MRSFVFMVTAAIDVAVAVVSGAVVRLAVVAITVIAIVIVIVFVVDDRHLLPWHPLPLRLLLLLSVSPSGSVLRT